jgi:cytidyltransferase-like protein
MIFSSRELYGGSGLQVYHPGERIVMTSCPADPLHSGHIACIQASKKYGDVLIVVVNGDDFLVNKKGYYVIPLKERLRIVQAIAGVDHVLGWDDDTPYVDGAIRLIRPHVFTKGGDRSRLEALAECEIKACIEVGAVMALGVGGYDKSNSSSRIIQSLLARVTKSGVTTSC